MNKSSAHIDCFPEHLTLYHYGELEPAEHRRVEEHLRECADCHRELVRIRMTLEGLPEMEPEFSPGELRSFNEQVALRLRPKRRPLKPAVGWSLAAATALLLVVILQPPLPGPPPPLSGVSWQDEAETGSLPAPELLLNMELLENLDMLQQLEGTGTSG